MEIINIRSLQHSNTPTLQYSISSIVLHVLPFFPYRMVYVLALIGLVVPPGPDPQAS